MGVMGIPLPVLPISLSWDQWQDTNGGDDYYTWSERMEPMCRKTTDSRDNRENGVDVVMSERIPRGMLCAKTDAATALSIHARCVM